MVHRGDVYFPSAQQPPGTPVPHRCIVVSPDALMQRPRGRLFVSMTLIRSARDPKTNVPRPLVMGHSILVTPQQCPFLSVDSIIETHQLLALPLTDLEPLRPVGTLPPNVLGKVLESIRRLFT